MSFKNGNTFYDNFNKEELLDCIENLLEQIETLRVPELARVQSCGCIVCQCEDVKQCHGCGAKNCGTHIVGGIPNPTYKDHPLRKYGREMYRKYVNASNELFHLKKTIEARST